MAVLEMLVSSIPDKTGVRPRKAGICHPDMAVIEMLLQEAAKRM